MFLDRWGFLEKNPDSSAAGSRSSRLERKLSLSLYCGQKLSSREAVTRYLNKLVNSKSDADRLLK